MDTKLTPSGATEPTSNSSPQQGQQPSAAPGQSMAPAVGALSPSASLTRPQSNIADAVNRALDQRQEQQLYSSTWSGVLHVLTTVIPTPARNDRQRVQELIQTLELLAEEQKKKHKSFDPREPIFFNQLASVIGVDRAEAFVTKTQKLASERNDPVAAAKLMREIAELIEGTQLGANYGIAAATVERELQGEFASRKYSDAAQGAEALIERLMSRAPARERMDNPEVAQFTARIEELATRRGELLALLQPQSSSTGGASDQSIASRLGLDREGELRVELTNIVRELGVMVGAGDVSPTSENQAVLDRYPELLDVTKPGNVISLHRDCVRHGAERVVSLTSDPTNPRSVAGVSGALDILLSNPPVDGGQVIELLNRVNLSKELLELVCVEYRAIHPNPPNNVRELLVAAVAPESRASLTLLLQGSRDLFLADYLCSLGAAPKPGHGVVVKSLLVAVSPGEIDRIESLLSSRQPPVVLTDLLTSIGGVDLRDWVRAIRSGDVALADAMTLQEVSFVAASTDQPWILVDFLESLGPEQRRGTVAAYERAYGKSFASYISETQGEPAKPRFTRAARELAIALIEANQPAICRAKVRMALGIPDGVADLARLNQALGEITPEQRQTILTEAQTWARGLTWRDNHSQRIQDYGGSHLAAFMSYSSEASTVKKCLELLEKGPTTAASLSTYAQDRQRAQALLPQITQLVADPQFSGESVLLSLAGLIPNRQTFEIVCAEYQAEHPGAAGDLRRLLLERMPAADPSEAPSRAAMIAGTNTQKAASHNREGLLLLLDGNRVGFLANRVRAYADRANTQAADDLRVMLGTASVEELNALDILLSQNSEPNLSARLQVIGGDDLRDFISARRDGNRALVGAITMHSLIGGNSPRPDELVTLLRVVGAKDAQQILRTFESRYGKILNSYLAEQVGEPPRARVSERDRSLVLAYVSGDPTRIESERLLRSLGLRGGALDERDVNQLLLQVSPARRAELLTLARTYARENYAALIGDSETGKSLSAPDTDPNAHLANVVLMRAAGDAKHATRLLRLLSMGPIDPSHLDMYMQARAVSGERAVIYDGVAGHFDEAERTRAALENGVRRNIQNTLDELNSNSNYWNPFSHLTGLRANMQRDVANDTALLSEYAQQGAAMQQARSQAIAAVTNARAAESEALDLLWEGNHSQAARQLQAAERSFKALSEVMNGPAARAMPDVTRWRAEMSHIQNGYSAVVQSCDRYEQGLRYAQTGLAVVGGGAVLIVSGGTATPLMAGLYVTLAMTPGVAVESGFELSNGQSAGDVAIQAGWRTFNNFTNAWGGASLTGIVARPTLVTWTTQGALREAGKEAVEQGARKIAEQGAKVAAKETAVNVEVARQYSLRLFGAGQRIGPAVPTQVSRAGSQLLAKPNTFVAGSRTVMNTAGRGGFGGWINAEDVGSTRNMQAQPLSTERPRPSDETDSTGSDGSGRTPWSGSFTFLDDLFDPNGKKKRSSSSPPGAPPPGPPPPIVPAMEVRLNSGDKPKPGDSPGPGGPTIDPGNGGGKTYFLPPLLDAQKGVTSAAANATAGSSDAKREQDELQETGDRLISLLEGNSGPLPQNVRQHFNDQARGLEDRIQLLGKQLENLVAERNKLDGEIRKVAADGGEIPVTFDKTRTDADVTIKEISRELAQLRERLEGLKESVSTAERQAQVRADVDARRELTPESWKKIQEVVALAQERLIGVTTQAQSVVTSALDTLAERIADVQARHEQLAQATALAAAAQARSDVAARAQTEARAETLRQSVSEAQSLVQQYAQELAAKVQDEREKPTQPRGADRVLVLNLVESAAHMAQETARAQLQAQGQEEHLPNKLLSEKLLATLPSEERAKLEEMQGLLSENLIQERGRLEGALNQFQRVEVEQQEQIATIQWMAEVVAWNLRDEGSLTSSSSDIGRKVTESCPIGSGGSSGSAPDAGAESKPGGGSGSSEIPPIIQAASLRGAAAALTSGSANAASSIPLSRSHPVRVSDGERIVVSAENFVSRPQDVPMMRELRVESELSEKRKIRQYDGVFRANMPESVAASRGEVPVIKEPSLSEVDELEQQSSQGGKKPKRAARELARAAEERQIIIQQLMAGVLEKSKREKLLRLLVELGISEIEYRDLVVKLGEMEARHVAEQAREETKQAIEIPVEPPRDTEPGQNEVPAMKSGAPKTNPTTVVPVTKETRAEMYARLRGARGKSSH